MAVVTRTSLLLLVGVVAVIEFGKGGVSDQMADDTTMKERRLDDLLGHGIVDTGQTECYSDVEEIKCPSPDQVFGGQDASYKTIVPAYQDNGDSTITDLRTNLMWTQERQNKMKLDAARRAASRSEIAGYTDWRLPTVTELYSLMNFSGVTPMSTLAQRTPTQYISPLFEWKFGDTDAGERLIDVQYMSDTEYVSTTFTNDATVFGVNFADGRIKGYPSATSTYHTIFVRGESLYGTHNYIASEDGLTVLDQVTDLEWMKADSIDTMDWPSALAYCQELELAGYSDWRLPDAKELQSIVDYAYSPDTSSSPALDPIFDSTSFVNEAGQIDWGYYWTSTSHKDGADIYQYAVYVSFGRALGYIEKNDGSGIFLDVHGAGCQRSDPKIGEWDDPTDTIAPQGDIIRISNYVRCVRGGAVVDDSSAIDETRPPEIIEPPVGGDDGTCTDSSSWHKKNDPTKNCAWIANDKSRCGVKGENSMLAYQECVESCATCPGPCENHDSPNWSRLGDSTKDCDWISTLYQSRCARSDNNGVYAFEACPYACHVCNHCEDDLVFSVNNSPFKDCEWVATNPQNRCPKTGIDSYGNTVYAFQSCPNACRVCPNYGECSDDAGWIKKNEDIGSDKDCDWVASAPLPDDSGNGAARCLIKGTNSVGDFAYAFEACRVTCGTC